MGKETKEIEDKKKKITLELTEFEIFKLEQLLNIGLEGLQNLELNLRGISDSTLQAITGYTKFVSNIQAQLTGADVSSRYEIHKMFFSVKLANQMKGGF